MFACPTNEQINKMWHIYIKNKQTWQKQGRKKNN